MTPLHVQAAQHAIAPAEAQLAAAKAEMEAAIAKFKALELGGGEQHVKGHNYR